MNILNKNFTAKYLALDWSMKQWYICYNLHHYIENIARSASITAEYLGVLISSAQVHANTFPVLSTSFNQQSTLQ